MVEIENITMNLEYGVTTDLILKYLNLK